MNRNALVFIALAITVVYGAGYAVFGQNVPGFYPMLGGPIIGLAWIAVGLFGGCRDTSQHRATDSSFSSPVQDTVRR